jgi:hypothetical protein
MIAHGIDDVGTLFPHDRPVMKGGSVATLTAAQKRTLAKMGIAMPDGSYYIRDAGELDDAIHAVGRGGADHDTIRKHIIKRAAALNLSSKIPDNWKSDGSMAQSMTEAGQEFIAHFGVKGMHWGIHKSREELLASAKKHDEKAVAHYKIAQAHLAANKDLETHGVHAKAFEDHYGKGTALQNPGLFQLAYGMNKAQAVGQLSEFHRASHNSYIRSTNRNFKKASHLRAKAAEMKHSSLEHFGVKGMHWGVRNVNPGSADHQRAQDVHHLIKTGGVKSASNQDLQDLVTRLNLEQQHARLTATPSRIDAGHNFVKKTLGITKTGIDVAKTTPEAIDAAKKVHKGIKVVAGTARVANNVHRGRHAFS